MIIWGIGIGLLVFSVASWVALFALPHFVWDYVDATPVKIVAIYVVQALWIAVAILLLRYLYIPPWRRVMLLAINSATFIAVTGTALRFGVKSFTVRDIDVRDLVFGVGDNVIIVALVVVLFGSSIYALLDVLDRRFSS